MKLPTSDKQCLYFCRQIYLYHNTPKHHLFVSIKCGSLVKVHVFVLCTQQLFVLHFLSTYHVFVTFVLCNVLNFYYHIENGKKNIDLKGECELKLLLILSYI